MSEHEELNKILNQANKKNASKAKARKTISRNSDPVSEKDDDSQEDLISKSYVQWTTSNGRIYIPAGKTKQRLAPGVYEIGSNPSIGLYFERIPVKTEGLLRFPDTNSDKVVDEITNFWEKEDKFREYALTYKRGIILWGPPGSGKSATLQLIMADVIKRGGVVFKFDEPYIFIDGMRVFRHIQPDTPVVVMMEDIDSIIEAYNESEVLNILDGVNEINKMIFLATTNYPGRLGARIINRPSRFDKRIKIDWPSAASRKMYFEHIIGVDKVKELEIDLDCWVRDTDKLSIAHLKELFIAVCILGDDYKEAIDALRTMKEDIDDREYDGNFGFTKQTNPD